MVGFRKDLFGACITRRMPLQSWRLS